MQAALFYDDVYDALRAVVNAAGGAKAVGAMLWPDKPLAMAHTALLNCLDRNRHENLSPSRVVMVLKLGRKVDCHAAIQYIAAECGYSVAPLEPEDELAALQRQYVEAVRLLASLTPKIEQAQAKLRAVGALLMCPTSLPTRCRCRQRGTRALSMSPANCARRERCPAA